MKIAHFGEYWLFLVKINQNVQFSCTILNALMRLWKKLPKLKSFKIHWIFEKNWSYIKKIIFGYFRAKKGKFHDFGQFSWFFAKFSKKKKTWGAISVKTKGRMKKFVRTEKFENTLNFRTHSVSYQKNHFWFQNVLLKKSIFF